MRMKLFKWYMIDDIDKMVYENAEVKMLSKRLKIAEEQNYEYFKEIQKLKEENLWLKNHQKIEIVNLESKGEDE